MNAAKVADNKPVVLDLEPGTYHWCTCGHSQKQPFCDGAHRGTGFAPMRFELDAPQKVALCACKQSKSGPNCDGSHAKL